MERGDGGRRVLQCAECGAVDVGLAIGWRAMLGLDDDADTETVGPTAFSVSALTTA